MFHKQFVDEYYERFRDAVEAKLLSATTHQLRQIKLTRIEEILRLIWERLLLRQHDWFDLQVLRSKVAVKIGLMFMKQPFLEKRIDGAKMIEQVCNTAVSQIGSGTATTTSERSKNLLRELIDSLRAANVLELFFSTKNIHEQLVKKSGGVLKLLMKRNEITDEELDYVWINCHKHESTSLELTGTFTTLCMVLEAKYLAYIANKLTEKSKAAINEKELELLRTMGRRVVNGDVALQEN